MLDDRSRFTSHFTSPPTPGSCRPGPAPWQGSDRRSSHDGESDWRFLLLDEVDYGVVVLDWDGRVVFVNQAARTQLKTSRALRLERGELAAASGRDRVHLASAIRAAAVQGLRRMVQVGDGPHTLALAVVPGPHCPGPNAHRVLVMLPRRRLCEPLSSYGFARDHGLSAAESQVLQQLCEGRQPAEIAVRQGVAMATVRSQIASIRVKTDAATVGELIQRVARLPPICGALLREADPGDAANRLTCAEPARA